MENTTISILNELLHITNDRQEGFEKVEGKIWEMNSDLQGKYEQMISQTKIMRNELMNLIIERGGKPEDEPSLAGTLHRTWIDIKNSFTINGIETSTLQNVIFGEKAATQAYQQAIDSGKLDSESIKIVSEQLSHIKESLAQFAGIEEYINKNS